jgi:hypothetical protein
MDSSGKGNDKSFQYDFNMSIKLVHDESSRVNFVFNEYYLSIFCVIFVFDSGWNTTSFSCHCNSLKLPGSLIFLPQEERGKLHSPYVFIDNGVDIYSEEWGSSLYLWEGDNLYIVKL